jgi:hypothetical protein
VGPGDMNVHPTGMFIGAHLHRPKRTLSDVITVGFGVGPVDMNVHPTISIAGKIILPKRPAILRKAVFAPEIIQVDVPDHAFVRLRVVQGV